MIQYAAIILFVFGLYGLFTNRNVIKMIVSVLDFIKYLIVLHVRQC